MSYLAVCGGLYSWNDFVATLNAQGHKLEVTRVVPPEAYDNSSPRWVHGFRRLGEGPHEADLTSPRHVRGCATRPLRRRHFNPGRRRSRLIRVWRDRTHSG